MSGLRTRSTAHVVSCQGVAGGLYFLHSKAILQESHHVLPHYGKELENDRAQ
jgi:hypothetical protein